MHQREKIVTRYIEDEMKSSYLDYAMSVIVGRALPDVRDGLKPVHRRIFYAMNQMGLSPEKPYRKSARIVGEVMGKYHPHGDMAIYATIVRMAQDFSLRYPLIDGQGNFGSIDEDPPAAMRYTEVKLSKIATEILRDIDKETVDYSPNFDDSLKEPLVLPTALPNLLVNGSSGIAVGMATNIPPHNLGEIVDGTIKVMENPELSVQKLMQIIPGPDFPTGGIIFGQDGVRDAYATGRGIITLRGKANTEKQPQGREKIIISEIPYQISKKALLQKIAALVNEKKIEGISDLRDESDRDGMRIVVDVKRGEETSVVINQLYKQTQLQTTFGIIFLSLINNRPQILGIKPLIQHFIDFRQEIVRKRIEYELRKAEARAHILEGLKIALSRIDEVIATIKASENVGEAREALITKFSLSEIQAQAILDMKLQRLTGLEQEKIEAEYLELIKAIARLKFILENEPEILQIIKEELLELKEKYGDKRRTDIIEKGVQLNMEDLIAEEEMIITISHTGYIKRLPVTTYRKQRRGGRGLSGMKTKEEDFVEHLFIGGTHDYILFFTNLGRIYWKKVYQIPEAGRLSKGKAIVNFLEVGKDEKVKAFIPVKDFEAGLFLFMATKKGVVKKTLLSAYKNPRANGIIGLGLKEGDELIQVEMTTGQDEIILSASHGKSIRFREEDIRPSGRAAKGVRGITLAKNDEVVGMAVVRRGLTLLTVTANGYGKRTELSNYRTQKRGGSGLIDIKTTERNGEVIRACEMGDQDEFMIMTESGMVIRTCASDISVIGRNTQGVRLIRINESDQVVGIAPVRE
ncbi:DNA gyrase subunit A [bacterium]|nr:DNA gyrase subunit A [bacterium]